MVYMMTPNRGIAAVQVASGTRLWSTTQEARPLALAGTRLAAQKEPQGDARILKIAVLDTRDGDVLRRAGVPPPEAVRASIDQRFDLTTQALDPAIARHEVPWAQAQPAGIVIPRLN